MDLSQVAVCFDRLRMDMVTNGNDWMGHYCSERRYRSDCSFIVATPIHSGDRLERKGSYKRVEVTDVKKYIEAYDHLKIHDYYTMYPEYKK